jgi:hypothetical protein
MEVQNARFIFFNTTEGATEEPVRVRGTNVSATPTLDPSVTGTFIMDLDDVHGEGLRILQLGDKLACYFDTGVIFLLPTLVSTAPYVKQVRTTSRGLLSTHALVDVGSGVHFGIFNDGWFFLDSTGRWIEAGTRTVEGKTHHKWRETFYSLLNWDERARVVVGVDHTDRSIRIAFPTGSNSDPDTVWTYDVERDTVWPQNYGDYPPNAWGSFDDVATDETWATISGTWDSIGSSATWSQYGQRTARTRQVHGTTGGLVFRHDASLASQDGESTIYQWENHASNRGLPAMNRRSDRLHVGYTRIEPDPSAITAKIKSPDASVEDSIAQTKGGDGDREVDFITGRVNHQRLGFGVSGMLPVRLNEFQFSYLIEGDEERHAS